ncbi:Alpha-1,3/1,6-mannosyltransferase ALG2 [Plasmodiophora brassicae]|uniref:Alpha-1,3/1,6-mannosyltransferase ALG2 n=1 Tax=Plasmodiophora brassicae TaxID=37360 RepID=A0A0G4IL96_PLABS|nr:hypothetical protein PBRA_004624 [Plasmodiophora brassicae]
MRIAFVHPDLGIGGAERLVVDAAVGLKRVGGHDVTIYTSHHDPGHAFAETCDGAVDVVVYGDFLPISLGGRFKIACALLRSVYLACRIVLRGQWPDLVFFDQISGCSPILWVMGVPLVFYCHFPDLLLSQRTSLLKGLYRIPFDLFEQATTALADRILVNSKFTRTVFAETFRFIRVVPEVLYPAINLDNYDKTFDRESSSAELPLRSFDQSNDIVFLSINRFERKKGIELAIEAFALLRTCTTPSAFSAAHLVIAGGYDPRVVENVEYERELKGIAEREGLRISDFPDVSGQVVFLRSFSEAQRSYLLNRCAAVVYTPQNEHFGIVPIEAMYARRPVIAANSGGPLESIVDGETGTGFLCRPVASEFAAKMKFILEHRGDANAMGARGRQHVIERFSLSAFSERLSQIVVDAAVEHASRSRVPFLLGLGLVLVAIVAGLRWAL